jgi:hypothetical protein
VATTSRTGGAVFSSPTTCSTIGGAAATVWTVGEKLSEQRTHLVCDGGPEVGHDLRFGRVRSSASGKLTATRFLKCFAQEPHFVCEHAALLAGARQLSVRFNTSVTDLVNAAARVGLRSAWSASVLRVDRRKLGIDLGQYLGDPRFELRDASGERGKNVVGRQQRWISAAALPACQPDQIFRALPLVLHLVKGTGRNRMKTGLLGGVSARRELAAERFAPRGSHTSRELPRREE